jgi:hypothetical protein
MPRVCSRTWFSEKETPQLMQGSERARRSMVVHVKGVQKFSSESGLGSSSVANWRARGRIGWTGGECARELGFGPGGGHCCISWTDCIPLRCATSWIDERLDGTIPLEQMARSQTTGLGERPANLARDYGV